MPLLHDNGFSFFQVSVVYLVLYMSKNAFFDFSLLFFLFQLFLLHCVFPSSLYHSLLFLLVLGRLFCGALRPFIALFIVGFHCLFVCFCLPNLQYFDILSIRQPLNIIKIKYVSTRIYLSFYLALLSKSFFNYEFLIAKSADCVKAQFQSRNPVYMQWAIKSLLNITILQPWIRNI